MPRVPRRRGAVLATLATLTLLFTALVEPVAASPKPAPRIIAGQPASFGEYPFMVALLFNSIPGSDFDKQYCGGSLIAPTWVLTAGHCVEFLTSPSEVSVAVGRTDLDSTQGQRIAVASIHLHPDYDDNALSPDVGLLELATPVTGIAPIQLASAADDGFEAAGTPLTAIGWGNTDSRPNHASFPDGLREVVLPAVSDARCGKIYKKYFIASTMLCAGEGGIDTCQGDSGGPMFATTTTGVRIQMGIVSWGIGCAKNHFPGVYGEVNSFTIREFIRTTTGV